MRIPSTVLTVFLALGLTLGASGFALAQPAATSTSAYAASAPTLRSPSSSATTASASAVGGSAALDAFMGMHFKKAYNTALNFADSIFIALLGVEMLYVTAMLFMKPEHSVGGSLAEFAWTAVKAIPVFILIQHAFDIVTFAEGQACDTALRITSKIGAGPSWVQAGTPISKACGKITPVSVFFYGLVKGAAIWTAQINITAFAKPPSWLGPVVSGAHVPLVAIPIIGIPIAFFVWLVLIGAFAYIGLDMLLIFVETQVVAAMGLVMFGFLGFSHTKFLGSGMAKYCVNIVVRMFFVYLFVGVGMGVVNGIWNASVFNYQFKSFPDLAAVMIAPLVFAFLVHRMDRIAASITTGSSSFNFRDEIAKPIGHAVSMAIKVAAVAAGAYGLVGTFEGTTGAAGPGGAGGQLALPGGGPSGGPPGGPNGFGMRMLANQSGKDGGSGNVPSPVPNDIAPPGGGPRRLSDARLSLPKPPERSEQPVAPPSGSAPPPAQGPNDALRADTIDTAAAAAVGQQMSSPRVAGQPSPGSGTSARSNTARAAQASSRPQARDAHGAPVAAEFVDEPDGGADSTIDAGTARPRGTPNVKRVQPATVRDIAGGSGAGGMGSAAQAPPVGPAPAAPPAGAPPAPKSVRDAVTAGWNNPLARMAALYEVSNLASRVIEETAGSMGTGSAGIDAGFGGK